MQLIQLEQFHEIENLCLDLGLINLIIWSEYSKTPVTSFFTWFETQFTLKFENILNQTLLA